MPPARRNDPKPTHLLWEGSRPRPAAPEVDSRNPSSDEDSRREEASGRPADAHPDGRTGCAAGWRHDLLRRWHPEVSGATAALTVAGQSPRPGPRCRTAPRPWPAKTRRARMPAAPATPISGRGGLAKGAPAPPAAVLASAPSHAGGNGRFPFGLEPPSITLDQTSGYRYSQIGPAAAGGGASGGVTREGEVVVSRDTAKVG
jgi:hypothetical protein